MSDESSGLPAVQPGYSSNLRQWDGGGGFGDEAPPSPTATTPIERAIAAIRRYKFLAIAVAIAAVGAGYGATRFVKPQYEVHATIWIASETPIQDKSGPIRSAELLNSDAWVELFRSYKIVDDVVRNLNLYLTPAKATDAPVFAGFTLGDRFQPGAYELTIDRPHKRWKLVLKKLLWTDSGAVADSVGRRFGFHWLIPATEFAGADARTVDFSVAVPREAAGVLSSNLDTHLAYESNLLHLTLHGTDPFLAAKTLNAWSNHFVEVSADLKKRNLVEFAGILSGQLTYAETSLKVAESALQDFQVHTITLPTEGGPVAAGVQDTRDPALKAYFEQKTEFDNLRHDRESLEKIVQDATKGTVPWESALLIPSVAQSPGAEALRTAFKDSYSLQAQLTAARQLYTDEYQPVKQLVASLNTLQTQTIPRLVNQLLVELTQREGQYDQRIAGASQDLQAIPSRTIEEMRLKRSVSVAEALYTNLKTRYQEAQLAEAGAAPDVNVLDSAIAPMFPTKNTKPTIMLLALAAGIGGGLALALLLDRLDRRIQYPEQVSMDLGLPIAGAVPRLPRGGVDLKSPEQVYQLVESFRSLRMSVMSSSPLPVSLAVSSPSPADGKSFISANLAMSFAEGGFRTLLIDGDTRRGALNEMFELSRSPGLTDHLAGVADRRSIVCATPHKNLWLMPSGTRRRQSPEFLTSPAFKELIESLRSEFEVVICDTPPFAAGIDAYAISTAAERLLVVLRVGKTERRMAAAKTLLLERLPVQVVGTVLNSVQLDGEFQYYGYVRGYEVQDEEEPTALLRG